jgi:hypothetical protein
MLFAAPGQRAYPTAHAIHEAHACSAAALCFVVYCSLPQGSERTLQYAAFFADCEHELSPISSGMRLVLVYNLVWVGQPGQAPKLHRESPAEVCIATVVSCVATVICCGLFSLC